MLLGHVYKLMAQEPYCIPIDKSNGLPANDVYDILQGKNGFMWIANGQGLTRYDGYAFKTYTSLRQSSRPGSNIKEDEGGRIWYENFDGYIFFVENDTMHILEQDKPVGYFPFAIIGKKLYCLRQYGIYIYNIDTRKKIDSIKIEPGSISKVFEDANHFYIYTKAIYCVSGNKLQLICNRLPVPSVEIKWLTGDGTFVYLGTASHIYKINNGISSQFGIIPSGITSRKEIFKDGHLWISTYGGAYLFDEKGHVSNDGKAYFPGKSIGAICPDRDGNIWIGTLNEGLLLMPDINLRLTSLGNYKPNKISLNGDTLYAGTENNQLISVALKKSTYKLLHEDKENHRVIYIYLDKGTRRIIYSSEHFNVLSFNASPSLSTTIAVKDICKINDKYYAFAASGICGLLSLKKDNSYNQWDSIFNTRLFSYKGYEASQIIVGVRGKTVAFNNTSSNIYYGTNTGLFVLNPRGYQELKYKGNTLFITSLQSYNSDVYALSSQGSIYRISAGSQISLLGIDGFDNNAIRNIKILKGHLFIWSDNTLGYIDLEKRETIKFNFIGSHVQATEINDLELWGDELILALDKGLLMINLFTAPKPGVPPLFVINRFSINGQSFNYKELTEVKYWQKEIAVDYSILSFGNAVYPLYYSINDGNWQLTAPESRSLKLSSLAPGRYKLLFRLGDNGPTRLINFRINKPYWLELWFIISCIIGLACITYILYHRQIKLIKKRNALLAEKMELEKNLNRSLLVSIRSQMNPHFFYNALNTIQSFIFANDKRNASAYLSRFSRLTRMILEMSERESVSLEEEIQALTIYLELEAARFDKDFAFELEMAQGLDKENIRIPSMIVQPYIENAIKHGLLHKKGAKSLSVKFLTQGYDLIIMIEDNGIGRKRSAEINNIKNGKHIPFSTIANQKRIDILNKGKSNIGVEYVDKYEENGIATGTLVKLTIPLMH